MVDGSGRDGGGVGKAVGVVSLTDDENCRSYGALEH